MRRYINLFDKIWESEGTKIGCTISKQHNKIDSINEKGEIKTVFNTKRNSINCPSLNDSEVE